MTQGEKFPESTIYSKEQGGDWAFDSALRGKVTLGAVSAGITVPVSFGAANDTCSCVTLTKVFSAAGRSTVLPADNAHSIFVKGFSLANHGVNPRKYSLNAGATYLESCALATHLVMNWNLIGQNRKIVNRTCFVTVDGATTAIVTLYYKAV